MYPHFDAADVIDFRVSRVRSVFALLDAELLGNGVPPVRTSLTGVFVVTSAQIVNGTLNVNETLAQAKAAAGDLEAMPATEPVSQAR